MSASDRKQASKYCLRFEEFDALAECGNDRSEDAHVLVPAPIGYGGEATLGVGRVAE